MEDILKKRNAANTDKVTGNSVYQIVWQAESCYLKPVICLPSSF